MHRPLYAATGLFNTVVRVDDGSSTILTTAADGRNQPCTLAFGTVRGEQQTRSASDFVIVEVGPRPASSCRPST